MKLSSLKKYSLHILSFGIAFFLWIYVQSTAQTTSVVTSRVHYIVPEGHAQVSTPVKFVEYTLKGPKAVIRSIESNPDILKINLSSVFRESQSEYEFSVQSLDYNTPLGIEIIKTEPRVIKIKLETELTKRVPISFQTIGNIPIDHKMIAQTINPKDIIIKGAKSIISKIESIKTQIVDLSKIRESGTQQIHLNNNDPRISLGTSKVLFDYQVKTTRSNMILKDIPIDFLSRHNIANSDTRVANLVVLAENVSDFKLKKEQIKIIAEVNNDGDKKQEVTLRAILPTGLHLLKIIPSKINISLEGKK